MTTYLFFISLLFMLLGCSNEKERHSYNIFGNIHRTSSFEKQKNILSGILLIEKVKILDSSGFATFPLSLGENTFVTSTNNGLIVCFENTQLLWEKSLERGEYVISNFVADWQKNIYFVTNYFRIISLSNFGEINWIRQLEDSTQWISTLLVSNDAIFFSTSTMKLYKYSFDGKLVWRKDLSLSTTQTFAGFEDGIVVNLSFDEFEKTDTVVFFDKNGNEKWKFYAEKARFIKSPVVFEDKVFVYGIESSLNSDKGVLFCLDADGSMKWKRNFAMIPRFLSISEDKELYLVLYAMGFGQKISELRKIDIDGNTINRQFISFTFYAPFLVGKVKLFNLGYKEDVPSIVYFGKDLVLTKNFDLSNAPIPLILPVVLEDGTVIYLASNGPYFIKIDENPILKLLPW
ncbi:MAG: outer membrane protein assembly factor BamB family protein [Candidatus Kapaibacteriales bacterium]